MTDPQLRSQGTQPPPPMGLAPHPRPNSQPNPFFAPARPALADPGPGAPAVRIHPAAEHGGFKTRDRNPRRVPAPTGRAQTMAPAGGLQPSLSRRMSSDDSGETEQSDPSKWFDRSNENPAESFGPRGMDGMYPSSPNRSCFECLLGDLSNLFQPSHVLKRTDLKRTARFCRCGRVFRAVALLLTSILL